MATDTQIEDFRISSLVGSAGTGSNGEKLVAAVASFYPEDLQRAQERRPNVALTDGLDLADVSKIAGLQVEQAVVRGGERDPDSAWVTYAAYDEHGDTVKGAFPYSDLGGSKSDQHIAQRDRLADSDVAREYATAQAKASASEAPAAAAPAGPVDPIASYEDMRWQEVVAYLDEHPERAEVIKALEVATRGEEDARKSVMEWEPKPAENDPGATPNS